MNVFFEDNNYIDICSRFRNTHEVGGFLLGIRKPDEFIIKNIFQINTSSNKGSFSPQPEEYQNELSEILCENSDIEIIGLWHSHPLGEAQFSLNDENTNRLYSKALNGCLSAIVTSNKTVVVYYINDDITEEVNII